MANNSKYNTNGNGRHEREEGPNEVSRSFEITTSEIQDYLQAKINSLCAAAHITDPIKIEVSSLSLSEKGRGRKLVPFLVMLSESARVQPKKGENDGINPVFQTDNQPGKLVVYDPIYKMMQSFQYTNTMMKWHAQPKTREHFNMRKDSMGPFREFQYARLVDSSKGVKMICMWFNPILVFYDYLRNVDGLGDNRGKYKVKVREVNLVNNDHAIYYVERTPVSKNRSGGSTEILRRIERRISNGGRF